MVHLGRIRFKLVLTFSMLVIAAGLNAQMTTPPDTSYFVSWDDNYNLILAADRGDTLSVILLLNRGANIDASTYEGVTSIMFASESGNFDLVRLLTERGADINKKPMNGVTALIAASQKNYYEIAEYLVGKKAELNTRDIEGVTAVHYAAAYNNYDIMDMLIFYGADMELADNQGNTPLISASYNNCLEAADLLIQNGAAIDARDHDGFTSLMTAIQLGNSDIAKFLVEKGADIHAVNKGGYSALSFAVLLGDLELTGELINMGADVNQKTEAGYTLLELAKTTGNDEIIDLLQSHDARTNLNPHFNTLSAGPFFDFNTGDFINGIQGSFLDDKYNIAINTGFGFRPMANRILDIISDTLSYQYWERRYYIYAGIDKKFNLMKGNYNATGPFIGINEFFTFGGYRGSDNHPRLRMITVPSIGWFYSGRFFRSWISYQYMDFKTPEIGPGRVNLGVSVNIRLTKRRLTNKRIDWLNLTGQ